MVPVVPSSSSRLPALLATVAALAALALGCDRPTHGVSTASPATPAPASDGAAPAPPSEAGGPPAPHPGDAGAHAGPAPLAAAAPLVELAVPGHAAAVVSVPLGATSRRPVLIATHGNYDRPEWQCEVWRGIVGNDAFVLCPRGVARSDSPSADDIRFTYASNQHLEREIDAGLQALKAGFPDHVDGGPALYTGFSLGAIMGVSIAARRPASFPRLVLIEGGHDKWTAAAARDFAKGGGQRVLFVCAQAGCAGTAKLAAARLEQAGVAAQVTRGKEVGHRYDGPVAEETQRALPWALEGDDRWIAR